MKHPFDRLVVLIPSRSRASLAATTRPHRRRPREGRRWAEHGRHPEDRRGRRDRRGLCRVPGRLRDRQRRFEGRSAGAAEGGARPGAQERGPPDRRRLHLVHRSPAPPAQPRPPQAGPQTPAVRGVLLGRRRRGRPEAVLPLPQGRQGEQRDDDVLPQRRVHAAGGEARPVPAAAALPGPLRHRLQRRGGHRRDRQAAAHGVAGGQRDRHPLQRPLLRQRRRGRRVVGGGMEGRDRSGEALREVLEDQHRHEERLPAALRLRQGAHRRPHALPGGPEELHEGRPRAGLPLRHQRCQRPGLAQEEARPVGPVDAARAVPRTLLRAVDDGLQLHGQPVGHQDPG